MMEGEKTTRNEKGDRAADINESVISRDKWHMFLGCPWTSAKLPVKAILSYLWSLNSQLVTNASHLYQYVWPVLSNLNARIKTSLEKSDGVKWEFKAEPDRLLFKHPRPVRDQGLETWLRAEGFAAKGESGQVEGLAAKESLKAGMSK